MKPNGPTTDPTSINAIGTIAGYYQGSAGTVHGFLNTPTSFSTVDFPGATQTKIFGINDLAQLVGSYTGAGCPNAAGCGFFAATVPVPFVNQPLVPATVVPGGAQFVLTVNGTGFGSGSVVNWNGTALVTTVVNSEQLTATVPAGNISSAGTASITVANTGTKAETSNAVFFPVTNPIASLSFNNASGSPVSAGSSPLSVAVGDFNHDGHPDLAVANNGSNTLTILLGHGDGTFAAAASPATGLNPVAVAVGDFNGDGHLDLAVVNQCGSDVTCKSSGSLTILLGDGTGNFTYRTSMTTGGSPQSVVAADFNGDGKLDLAVANSGVNTLTILLGNGDGTFATTAASPATGGIPVSLAVGDFNGDGKLDLAVANQADNTTSILLGDGTGHFASSGASSGTGTIPTSVVAADFNGDGRLDLAVTNASTGTVSVYFRLPASFLRRRCRSWTTKPSR